jgi:chaperonin GroES
MTATLVTAVTPLADRVVVRPLEEHDRTQGGLYIPDTAREKPQQGEVIAAGPGRYDSGALVPMGVAVGDKVLYGRFNGIDVTLDGQVCVILRESDLLAVVA